MDDHQFESAMEMIDGRDAENVRLREAMRGATVVANHAGAEIERLRARLDLIADIAEGSTTPNSLPHIAKIARGVDEQSTTERP